MQQNEQINPVMNFALENHPANEFRWSKTPLITILEATYLSYGVEPPNVREGKGFPAHYFEAFSRECDKYSIYDLTWAAFQAGKLRMSTNNQISAVEFVKWANEHKIPILEKFFYKDRTKQESHSAQDCESQQTLKQDRAPTILSMRKKIGTFCGMILNDRLKSKKQRPLPPSELANNNEIIRIVNAVSDLADLENCEELDPEWFKDCYEGLKRGPKPKKGKK